MLDLYCERLGPGLLAEPLNAVSNLAFFVAAFCAWRLSRFPRDAGAVLLILIVVVIGAGSAAFHTFATYPAMLADTIPILIFQLCFLPLFACQVLGASTARTAALFGLYIASVAGFSLLPQGWLNGSVSYLPALLFLLILGAMEWKILGRKILFAAAGVFTLSLTFRSLDNALCDSVPFGLHFLWHILNGCVLFLSLKAYITGTRRA